MSIYYRDRYDDPYSDYDWDNDGYPGEYVYGDDVYIDECYMGELWKPVCGFPGYWISDMGRVWSSKKQKFLTPWLADSWGHYGVCLCYNGRSYHKYIHRLMAEAFIPNPNNYPVVRHFNDIPDDNVLENLKWGTNRDNTIDAIRNGKLKGFTDEARQRALKTCRKPIIARHIITGRTIKYDGVSLAAIDLNIARSSISKVLIGERKQTNGWTFEYAEGGNYDE